MEDVNMDEMKLSDVMNLQIGKGAADHISLKGVMEATLYDQFGNVKDYRKEKNLVTTLGIYMAAAQVLATPVIVKPGWMELGTGSGQTIASSTLAAYIAGSRTALDSKTRSNGVITMVCTFAAGVGTGAVTEAGVFNVVTENTTDLILYSSFAVVNKGVLDPLVIVWTFTFA